MPTRKWKRGGKKIVQNLTNRWERGGINGGGGVGGVLKNCSKLNKGGYKFDNRGGVEKIF